MTLKSSKEIRESIFADYRQQFPGENLYSKVFSAYILDRHVKLLMRIYKKTEELKNKDGE